MKAGLLAGVLFVGAAAAQDVRVFSEFTRVNTRGDVVRADRAASYREILSPAIPRNGYSTFRVVISAPTGTGYTLAVGQNPEDAVELTVYREAYRNSGGEWVPDGIERVTLPYEGHLGESPDRGQTAQSFLIDLRVDRDAPVRRIKVEPQVWMIDRWITYPMEVRVVEARVPDGSLATAVRADLALASDATVWAVYRNTLCRGPASGTLGAELSGRSLMARNASQDVRAVRAWKLSIAPFPRWCDPFRVNEKGPEWYLKIRDRIWGARE
jgi:hypothetical protein